MASDNPSAKTEGLEHQDQSIKDRKSQLFEGQKPEVDEVVAVRKPFSHYVLQTPPAPMSSGVKASLWATAVLVALLFLAALSSGGKKPRKPGAAALPPGRPAAVAWHVAAPGQTPSSDNSTASN